MAITVAFPVSGANCYFLSYCSTAARVPLLRAVRAMGGVARTWAFPDGRPDWFERLDALIADAGQEGVRLILPLVNHWPDFGGAPGWLAGLGIDGPVEEFYRQEAPRQAYRDYVTTVLTRVNGITGRRYRDEPAILAWELANEPRCERELLIDWAAGMSAHVKSIDDRHLLAVGDEGQELEALLAIESIDFGTYHFYPEAWRIQPKNGRKWIERHVQAGLRAGKPVVLEEYGLRDAAARERWYPEWTRAAERGGGSLVWMLGSRNPEVAGFRDDYTMYADEGWGE